MSLLLDRSWLGVALDNDQAAQVRSVLARDFLPGVFTLVVTECNLAIWFLISQEDAPPVVGHLDVVKVCPTLLPDANCGSQEHGVALKRRRTHVFPPPDEFRLPTFECPLQATVVGQADVVWDLGVDVDNSHGSYSPVIE